MFVIPPNSPMFDRADYMHRRPATLRLERHFFYPLQVQSTSLENRQLKCPREKIMIEFGEQTRREHYLMDQNVVYVNHGSYGPCPRVVFEDLQRLRLEQERNPDRWFRSGKADLYVDNVRVAARRLECDFEQLALVENATVGVNAILKTALPTFTKRPGGSILCTNLAYGSVLFTIELAAKQHGMQVRMMDIQFPIDSKQMLIEKFEDELKKGDVENIRLAVIDHITSATAVLFPINELIDLFHAHDIPVLVDGAHGPGQVSPRFSLAKLACDFYVGTFHKWMYAARGCSFLFVRDPALANQIQPGNTSWGYRLPAVPLGPMTLFHHQFFNQGTRDDSALFTITKAIDFVDSFAGEFDRIHEYNSKLSLEAKSMLEQRWNTKGKDLVCEDLHAPYLKMIQMPDLRDYKKTEADALRLLNHLIGHHKLVSIILYVNGQLYVRIATQIYNRIEDYIVLADTIEKFI